ncbi:MAG: Arc family DNA-binding protein [Coriobacteriia bacterium]|nr:Arc family DNA-binding protein [Coriobacteriia bacterium]
MPDFLIRGLDEDTMTKLKARAEQHGRSLQAEIHDTLKGSVRLSKAESIELIKRLQAKTAGRGLGDSTKLIREDRSSR